MHGLLTSLLLMTPTTAEAAEVTWGGYYRSRFRYFNSLSLSTENEFSEGSSWWADHRLRLRPTFILSNHVSLHSHVDVLPFVNWGQEPTDYADLSAGTTDAAAYSQTVNPPTAEDGSAGTQNLQVRSAFAELTTDRVTASFGRMPTHWGSGMVWNAGGDPNSEYGDFADRVSLITSVGPVFLITAFETNAEQFVNESDDLKTAVGGVMWQGEKAGVGTYNTYRWQTFGEDNKFQLYTGDIWAEAQLGMSHFEFELAFQLGGGDLDESINDVRVTGLGTHLSATLGGEKLSGGLAGGITTGDQDPFDTEFHAFSFDPDFNVALMMFQEPMPVLTHENPHLQNNGGREYGAVRMGDRISNAMYLRPAIGYRFHDTLSADIAFIAAQATKVPERDKDERGYGAEIDLSLRYTPFEHFSLESTTGVYMPGKYVTKFKHDDLGGGFTETAIGSRLLATVNF